MIITKMSIDAKELGDPASSIWEQTVAKKVPLYPTPVAMQPSKYIVGKWKDGEFGMTTALGVQALHNGDEIAFRLEWESDDGKQTIRDNDDFPDAAALMFPFKEDATLMSMGSEDNPVNVWHWKAHHPEVAPSNVITGIGTSEVVEKGAVITQASYQQGRWQLVLRRKMNLFSSEAPAIQFITGNKLKVAFAVWAGSNSERGGLKSFSPNWLEFEL